MKNLEPLTDKLRQKIMTENVAEGLASSLRVLAFAQREFDPATFDPNADPMPLMQELELCALIAEVDALHAVRQRRRSLPPMELASRSACHRPLCATAAAIAERAGHRGASGDRR